MDNRHVFLIPSRNHLNHFSEIIISDNCLSRELQSFLFPLNFIENIIYLSKYSIRDNFITSNNRYANIFSYIATIILIFIYILLISLDKGVRNFKHDVLFIGIIHYILLIIGRIIYNFTNNGFSNCHVNLIISIDRMQRSLKIKYKNFITYNWLLFFLICFYYIILFIIQAYANRSTLLVCYSYFILFIDDLNTVYLILINKLLLEYTMLYETKLKTVNYSYTSPTSVRQREETLNSMVDIFVEISKATSAYKYISEIPMFYRMAFITIYCLTYVQLIIMFQNTPDNMIWVLLLCWFIKTFFFVWMICYNSENLKLTLYNIQATILSMMMEDNSGEDVSKYNTLLQESTVSCKVMETSVILKVDAKLPLALLSVSATYTVVLLQFAFR
nr:gustatory receptor 30 [Papilio dardanus]